MKTGRNFTHYVSQIVFCIGENGLEWMKAPSDTCRLSEMRNKASMATEAYQETLTLFHQDVLFHTFHPVV